MTWSGLGLLLEWCGHSPGLAAAAPAAQEALLPPAARLHLSHTQTCYSPARPQERLPEERFELMLWKLEVSNAAATDHALAFAGAAPAERMSVAACATTDHLPREDALTILEETCSGEEGECVCVLRGGVGAMWAQVAAAANGSRGAVGRWGEVLSGASLFNKKSQSSPAAWLCLTGCCCLTARALPPPACCRSARRHACVGVRLLAGQAAAAGEAHPAAALRPHPHRRQQPLQRVQVRRLVGACEGGGPAIRCWLLIRHSTQRTFELNPKPRCRRPPAGRVSGCTGRRRGGGARTTRTRWRR